MKEEKKIAAVIKRGKRRRKKT